MVGTLPPLKGMSDYCIELTQELSKYVEIDFISFKKLYPDFLYPGGTKDNDENFKLEANKNIKIRNLLTYYNPFTWVWGGLSAKGEIVHFQWWTTFLSPIFFVMMVFLKARGKKIIFTVHNVLGHETNIIDRIVTKIMFMFPDFFVLHSTKNIEKMEELFGIEKKRMARIPHGIYDFYENEKVTKKESRKKLGIDDKTPVALSFGNIREYKGVDILIKAFAVVKDEIPDACLIIAGKPWIDWKPNQKLIEEYNLKKNVRTFLDYVSMSDVKHYFKACDLVALPYKEFEAQSGPGNIALAFHKPLIVSNTGGLPDLLKNKEFVIEKNNARQLAEKIIKILKNKKIAEQLSKDSKEMCREYSWKDIGKKTANLYKGLK
jgi:glycosyltransferase involved in cell wall biosynthesis